MREEDFSMQNTLEGNYLNITLPASTELDEIAVRVIEGDCPEFLIPFHVVSVNGNRNLKYKLINTVALEYSERKMNKQQFVQLFMKLLMPFMKGKDWFLDYHNFCVNPRYIFLDKTGSGVSFIYVPEKQAGQTDEEIKAFFKQLFTEITILNDPEFQVRMFQYFASPDANLADLYQILLQEGKTTVSNVGGNTNSREVLKQNETFQKQETDEIKPQGLNMEQTKKNGSEQEKQTGKFSFFGIHPKGSTEAEKKAEVPENPEEDADAAVDALFGSKPKKKSLFGKKKEKPEKVVQKEEKSAVIVQEQKPVQQMVQMPVFESMTEDSTEISSETEVENGVWLELTESEIPGAIQKISLDFPGKYITIGRMSSDEVQPDVAFGKQFTRIGRRHARIEKRGNDFYIIDLGSANGTLLNGQKLIPNQPYLLEEGGEICFTVTKPVKYRVLRHDEWLRMGD